MQPIIICISEAQKNLEYRDITAYFASNHTSITQSLISMASNYKQETIMKLIILNYMIPM
jgi:hypothetical protein